MLTVELEFALMDNCKHVFNEQKKKYQNVPIARAFLNNNNEKSMSSWMDGIVVEMLL